jgi:hypothetical protein
VGYLMGALDVARSGYLGHSDFSELFSDAKLGFEVSRVEKEGSLQARGITNTHKPGMAASIALSGIASIIAVNFIHPIELVKTRIQVVSRVY